VRNLLFEIFEGLMIALRAIRAHKLRAILTTLGIIIGITSVTSMVTVINGIEQDFERSMSELGADVLYVEKWPWMTGPGFKWWNYINRPRITEDLVSVIEARSRYAVAVAPVVSTGRPVKASGETVTGVRVEGSTPTYELIHAVRLNEGRFYTDMDQRSARNVAVIGASLAEMLFPVQNPLGKMIRVGGQPFQVIGVLEKRGSGGESSSDDNQIKIPFSTFKRHFGVTYRDISVRVKVGSPDLLDSAQDELTGILRAARRLDALQEDNFVINQQQNLRQQLAPVKFAIYGIGIFLTALSLLVGGIGVMNIMFVSVKERTREIGIRKAVGAKRRNILTQFLIEAVIISVIGGAIAVGLALGLTGLIRTVMPAYLPFSTILLAFGICVGIGVIFGLAPAWTAARAEPIDALRYE
jgi:putative ABC transport system permease protein